MQEKIRNIGKFFKGFRKSSYAQTEIDEIALLNQEIRRLTEDDSVKRRLEFASDVLKAEDPLSTLKSMGVRNERLMIVKFETDHPKTSFTGIVSILADSSGIEEEMKNEWLLRAKKAQTVEDGFLKKIEVSLGRGLSFEMNSLSGRSCLYLVEQK